jgi:hypothetical protein
MYSLTEPVALKFVLCVLLLIVCLQFAEVNASPIAAAREAYVLASVMEEKTANLQRRLDEATKSLERALAAFND